LWCCTQEEKNKKINSICFACFALQQEDFIWVVFSSSSSSSCNGNGKQSTKARVLSFCSFCMEMGEEERKKEKFVRELVVQQLLCGKKW
jgi:hypothetical protein